MSNGAAKAIKKNIIKSNSLVSARYTQRYSLHEQRTILYLLALIDENNIQKNEYEVGIKQYAEFLQVDPSYIYQEAEQIAKKLASKAIKIEDTNGGWIICSWLSGMRYKDGKLYLSVYDGLKPYILNLKSNFTKYQLQYIMQLNSSYAIRVYEILSQFVKIGSRTVELEVLREMLGIPQNELKQFVHFKATVLEISQREINTKTDIHFEWEPIKQSRKIVGIKFSINKKTKNLPENIIDDKIRVDLEKLDFNISEIGKLCKDYDQELICEKIDYLHFNLKNKKEIKEPKRWLISAIVENYNTSDMPKLRATSFSSQERICYDLKEKIKKINYSILDIEKQLQGWLAKYDESHRQALENEIQLHKTQLAAFKAELDLAMKTS